MRQSIRQVRYLRRRGQNLFSNYALAAAETPDRLSKDEDRYSQQRVLKLWILLNIYHFYEFDWNRLRFRWEGARTLPKGGCLFCRCTFVSSAISV